MKTADGLLNGAAAGPKFPSQDLNEPRAIEDVDIVQRYNEERDKRLRADGMAQYIDPVKSEKHKHFLDDPWVEAGVPINRPVPDGGHTKFLIIGAGYGGIMYAVKLLQAGFSIDDLLIVDPAGGFGGTWYWNRYPGLMCDVESYIYLPLLQETGYMPKHKYSSGEEIRKYVESLCQKFDLYKRASFQTAVADLVWEKNVWKAKIVEKPKGGSHSPLTLTADYVMFATGPMNNAKLPDIPGFDDFKGSMFHTSRWDYNVTGGSQENPLLMNLRDKKVALIGTGATGVQAVPQVAKWANELYVFQRTPSAVDVRGNHETDPEWWGKMSAEKDWQRKRNENFNLFLNNAATDEPNLVDDEWSRNVTFSALIGGPKHVTMENMQEHVAELQALDLPRQEKVRKRVTKLVKDPQTAKSLQAWYPSWCKRPCFHDDYLPSFNLRNVHLVDTAGKGVERITEHGLVFGDQEIQADVIIFGTGYYSPFLGSAAGKAKITVTGKNGEVFETRSDMGELGTLHGITARDFPNLYWPGPLQSATTANQTWCLEMNTSHIAHIIAEAEKKVGGKAIIEPSVEAQKEWADEIMSRSASLAAMGGCTPGYFNMEGMADKLPPEFQLKMARNTIWGSGMASFVKVLEDWRAKGDLRGLEITASS